MKGINPKSSKESVEIFTQSKAITDSIFQSNQFKLFSKNVTASKNSNKTSKDLIELITAFQALPEMP